MPAKDGSRFTTLAKCDGFAARPPAWHWYNPETKAVDAPRDTPLGGSFFHSAGVICAPWNRLAYKGVDARGPHDNWTIGNWMTIPETGGTRRSEEHTSELQSLMRISYAVLCLKKK